MQINESIIEKISKEPDAANILCFLLLLYYKIDYTNICREKTINKAIKKGIVDEKLKWKIELFKENVDKFDWVKKEYIPIFESKNKYGYELESLARMKSFFKEHKNSFSKDQIIQATQNYVDSVDQNYLRNAHYFIYKGVGVNRVSDLLSWVTKLTKEDVYKESKDLKNKLQ